MTDRSDKIPLPPSEKRCVPSDPCGAAKKCARALASIPSHGAIVFDGVGAWKQTVGAAKGAGIAFCPHFLDVGLVKAPAPAEKKAKPWVGDQT